MSKDARVSISLMYDVDEVLKRHGFKLPSDKVAAYIAMDRMLIALLHLVRVYEGKIEI